MTDLRIIDAPEVATITGVEKIPTGNSGGNFAISVDSLTQYVKDSKDLQSGAEVEATVAPVEMEIATHVADLENPHEVTKEQVGLGNVDNTADTDKPISSAVAAAITTLTTNKADKTYVDSQLALKANQLTTYTKTDVDNLLATKANQSTTYTKTEVNTFLTNKQERLSVDGTLTGSRSFDTVPKLDGLDGNPSPIMNQQAQALMNRTESLNYDISTMLNYYDSSFSVSVGGYPLNSRVVLSDGTLVRSNISNNINNPNTDMTGWELALPHVNTEGTYTKVTTDKYGRVVSGENPNTLAGIGITNAYTKTEVDSVISAISIKGLTGFSNLKISSLGINNYQSAITASKAVLANSSGKTVTLSGISVTSQISVSGVNGLDTGTVVANTWYYLYLISDGTLVRGLFSLSATAPTLPSGYTYFTRIGAVRAGASGYLLQTLQYGSRVQYVVTTGSNTPNLPIIAQGALGVYSSTTPTYVAASVSSFVPPTANTIVVTASQYFGGGASVIGLAPNSSYGGIASNRPPLLSGDNAGALNKSTISMLLESSNIYVYSSGANGLFQSVGWEDNL